MTPEWIHLNTAWDLALQAGPHLFSDLLCVVSPVLHNKAFASKCKTENSVVCVFAPIVVEEKEKGHRQCFQDVVKISMVTQRVESDPGLMRKTLWGEIWTVFLFWIDILKIKYKKYWHLWADMISYNNCYIVIINQYRFGSKLNIYECNL